MFQSNPFPPMLKRTIFLRCSKMMVPKIIQVMDDHVSIRTHGDLGIRHFKKPPFGERLVHPFRIGQMKKLEPWKLLGRIVASRKKETTQKKDNKRIEKLGGSTVLQFYRLFFSKILGDLFFPMAHPFTKVWRPISTKIGDMEPLNSLITIWLVNIAMANHNFLVR